MPAGRVHGLESCAAGQQRKARLHLGSSSPQKTPPPPAPLVHALDSMQCFRCGAWVGWARGGGDLAPLIAAGRRDGRSAVTRAKAERRLSNSVATWLLVAPVVYTHEASFLARGAALRKANAG
eukprot:256517-Chlamydomonas_euryale.AAC.1